MKSAKTRQKAQEPDSQLPSINLNVALQVVPLSDARNMLNHFDKPLEQRTVLDSFLSYRQQGYIQRVKRLGAHTSEHTARANKSVKNTPKSTQQSTPKTLSRQPSIHLPGEFLPETDLWYAAYLDYLMEAIHWAVNEWIPGCETESQHRLVNNCLLIENYAEIKTPADEKSLAIVLVLATLLVLIGHVQRLTQSKVDLIDDVNASVERNSSNLVSTIRLLKQFFQTVPQISEKLDYETAELDQFERHHQGMLSALNVNAAAQMIHFLTTNFLHLYRLMQQCFGLAETYRLNLVEIPCHLKVHTLPQRFGRTRSVWPPPLVESLPLSLIANYPHLFDDRVTKWLPCLPAASPPASTESISVRTTSPTEPGKSDRSEDNQQPVIDPWEKYLAALDGMRREQWEALASVSDNQAQDVVRLVLSELPIAGDLSVRDTLTERLHESQLLLAKRLVDQARDKINNLNAKENS